MNTGISATPALLVIMTRMRAEDEHGTENAAFDLKALGALALAHVGDEVFIPFIDTPDLRIGVSARLATGGVVRYTLEALISVLHRGGSLEFASSERALWLARAMEERGYTLTHNDDGWIVCELQVERDQVEPECNYIQDLLGGCPGDGHNGN